MDLDEEATVDASAQSGSLVPVFHARLERWFEASLVVDHSPSAEIWAQTVIELERVLKLTGVFRDVRTFRLERKAELRLLNESGTLQRLSALRDPTARRIIFLFSSGVSESWNDGTFGRLIRDWGASTPVALLHALPRRLWSNTALGEPLALATNRGLGGPNTGLKWKRAWWAVARRIEGTRVTLPVLGLDPESTRRWAEMFTGRRGRSAPAFLVPTETSPDRRLREAGRRQLSVQGRIDLFRTYAPDAFKLAVRLAVGPFTMPILQLVQTSLFGRDADHSQVAELMLSGLVRRITPIDKMIPSDQVQFQFTSDASPFLLESLRRDDARQLASLLQGYIERHFGTSRDQIALLEYPEGPALIPAGAKPFVHLNERFHQWLTETSLRTPYPIPEQEIENPEPVPEPIEYDNDSLFYTFTSLSAERALLNGVRILWVGDLTSNNPVEAEMLRKLGVDFTILASTEGALEIMQTVTFEIILTDMPSPDNREAGLELLAEVQKRKSSTRVIIYSASWVRKDANRQRAILAGAFGVTDQPEELVQLVLEAAPTTAARRFMLHYRKEIVQSEILAPMVDDLLHSSHKMAAAKVETAGSNPVQRLDALVAALSAFSQSRYVQVFRLEAKELRLVAQRIASGMATYSLASFDGLIGKAALTKRLVWVADISLEPTYIAAEKSTRSELVIPSSAEPGEDRFVVNIERELPHAYSPAQIAWLTAFVEAYRFTSQASDNLDQTQRGPQKPERHNRLPASEATIQVDPILAGVEVIIDGSVLQAVSTDEWTVPLTSGSHFIELPEAGIFSVFEHPQPDGSGARVQVPWALRERAVLVAGTGSHELSQPEFWMSEAVGHALAVAGFPLVTGGWRGVDHVVAAAYAKRVLPADIGPDHWLTQVVQYGRQPDFDGGRVINTLQDFEFPLTLVEDIILIGGKGGTLEIFRRSLAANKRVYPIPATGGDAKQAFDDLFSSSQSDVEVLRRLDAPIETPDDARQIARTLVAMLFAPEATRPPPVSSERDQARAALLRIDIDCRDNVVLDIVLEAARFRPIPGFEQSISLSRLFCGTLTVADRLRDRAIEQQPFLEAFDNTLRSSRWSQMSNDIMAQFERLDLPEALKRLELGFSDSARNALQRAARPSADSDGISAESIVMAILTPEPTYQSSFLYKHLSNLPDLREEFEKRAGIRVPPIKFATVAQADIATDRSVEKDRIDRCINGSGDQVDSFSNQREFMQLCRSLRSCLPALDKLFRTLSRYSGSDVFPQRVILRARMGCTNVSEEISAFAIPEHEPVEFAYDQRLPNAPPIYYRCFPSSRVELAPGASRYVDIEVALFCEDHDVVGLRERLGRDDLDVDALFFLLGSERIRELIKVAAAPNGGLPLQLNVWFADGITRPVEVLFQISKVPESITLKWIYTGVTVDGALRELHEWGDPFHRLGMRMSLLQSIWRHKEQRPSRGPERREALNRIRSLVGELPSDIGAGLGSVIDDAADDIGVEGPTALVDAAALAGSFLEGGALRSSMDLLRAAAAGHFIPILPECILDLMEQQLQSKLQLAPAILATCREDLGFLNGLTGERLPPIVRPPFISTADFICDLAVAARADYIITTDQELLGLRSLHLEMGQGHLIKIVDPEEFLVALGISPPDPIAA